MLFLVALQGNPSVKLDTPQKEGIGYAIGYDQTSGRH